MLLSTFNWTNRNDFSGEADNRFDEVFGPLAGQAVAAVDAAIAQWQRVITSFNYADPNANDTYSLTIKMAAAPLTTGSPTSVGASASVSGFVGNKPSSANVTINYRAIGASGNTVGGWWLDPSPIDNSEFAGIAGNTHAWVGVPTSTLGGGDLVIVIVHELGHAVGLFAGPKIDAFTTNTGVVDTLNTPASVPPANLWRFDSPNVHTRWTAWNSSGGSGQPGTNSNGAEHSAPLGSAPLFQNNRTYYAYTDLMNASGGGTRELIATTHALMLQDAYAYTVKDPETFGTFYDRLDADGTLTIRTPGDGGDIVKLEVIGSNLVVSMDLGSPVVGADPIALNSIFPLSVIEEIEISTGGGADRVIVGPIISAGDMVPIVVALGGGGTCWRSTGRAGTTRSARTRFG